MKHHGLLLAALALAGCDDDHCRPPRVYAPTGSGSVASGELTPSAQDQRILISADRLVLEYTFTRDGVTTTARYALSEKPPAPPIRYIEVRRAPPLAECAALAGRGPVIDAVEVRRGGALLSTGMAAYQSAARCKEQVLTGKASESLNGAPDGAGAALAEGEFGWAINQRLTLLPGDEITVTVLDGPAEPFDVYVTQWQSGFGPLLGQLTGTGALTVP